LSTEFESEEGKGSEAFSVIIGDNKKKKEKRKRNLLTPKKEKKKKWSKLRCHFSDLHGHYC
jgi:hypothetical protein